MYQRSLRHSSFFSFLFLACLLCACSSLPAPQQGNAAPVATSTATQSSVPSTPTPSPAPAQPPLTLTSCPPSGTARAAMMSSVTLGTHQVVLYLRNQGATRPGDYGVLSQYDVTTGSTTTLVKLNNASLHGAQLSTDGQWALFAATTAQGAKIELVRVDGQALQTIYCSPPSQDISTLLWSPDQKSVLLAQVQADSPLTLTGIYLLDMTSGKVQKELGAQASNYALPVLWLDNTHVYFQDFTATPQPTKIYLLDTSKAAPQQRTGLERIGTIQAFGSFEKSMDGTQLLLSQCSLTQQGYPSGPSTITTRSAAGGLPHTIYKSRTFAITDIRMISPTTLLLIVANGSSKAKDNGLWKVHLDGTGLTRLTTDSQSVYNDGFATSRFPWTNVSRDGTFYSILNQNASGNNCHSSNNLARFCHKTCQRTA